MKWMSSGRRTRKIKSCRLFFTLHRSSSSSRSASPSQSAEIQPIGTVSQSVSQSVITFPVSSMHCQSPVHCIGESAHIDLLLRPPLLPRPSSSDRPLHLVLSYPYTRRAQ